MPISKTIGDAGFDLTVNGTNFISSSVANFAGSPRATHYVSANQLTATILASDLTTLGTFDITVTNPELLKDWNDDRDPSNFTFGSDAKINWKCSKCGNIWKSQLKTRAISKYGCPKCSESKGEIKILEILISNNIIVEKQKRYEKCRYKKPLPFDFYLPTFNILIEYQGIHHYKSHCKNFRHSKRYCDENLDLVAKKDKIKQNFCYRNNIRLIRIPYYRLDKIEDILRKYSIIK